ncbi:MAG TPA: branched-chain amino acid ABC transporter permease [Casimicrobiaceae bacterium]|nr:branched-chain amino acid ABC transporter permease [Casimicrobiaceae bacterium]
MDLFVAALVTGVGLGSMYGLLALGFYVTYAVSNTVNFAQGSTMMLGAVMGFTFGVTLAWPWMPAILVALLVCAGWGVVVEAIGVRPFARKRSDLWLMATVALGLILENVVLFTFGKDPRGMPQTSLTAEAFSAGGLRVSILQVIIPLVGLLIAFALHALTRYTRMGKSMLAIVQNPDAARLMGIDVRAAIVAAYALSGLFAGIAGLLIAPLFTVSSGMGTLFGIKAFAVAILGGIGNPWGVVLAGLLYGSAESLITAAFGSTYTQILTFGLVIVALALRPDGLFGRAGVKKV